MLDDRPREEQVVPLGRRRASPQTTSISSSGSGSASRSCTSRPPSTRFRSHSDGSNGAPLRSLRIRDAGLLRERLDGGRVVAGREQHLDELLREPLAERRADRPVEHDHAAVRRHRVGGERLLVGLLDRLGDRHAARVVVLDDHAGRAVELDREEPRGGEVVEVVERQRLAVELLDAREQVRAGAALGVVGGLLVRVLAVGELERWSKTGHERSRGSPRRADSQPAIALSYAAVVANAAAASSRRVSTDDVVAVAQLVRARARSRPGGRRGSTCAWFLAAARSIAGPPMSIFSIASSQLDVEAADGLLEGVEVDADEVDRLDPVSGEVGDVLRHVAAGEDAAVHRRVQRDDAVAEHLGEARQLLERASRRCPSSASSRAVPPLATSSKPSAAQLLGERRDAGLVVDGEERAPHAAISSRTTSGSSRCSTARIRACSVSGVSPGSTGNGLLPEDGAGVDALVDEVHGHPRLGDARRERLLDGVGAGEGRQQRRVHVDDSIGEAVEERRPSGGACSPRRRRARPRARRASRPSRRRARRGPA